MRPSDIARALEYRGDYMQLNMLSVEDARARILSRVTLLGTEEVGIVEALGGRLAIVPEETPNDPHCAFIEFE